MTDANGSLSPSSANGLAKGLSSMADRDEV
jgi:hypothetical protein